MALPHHSHYHKETQKIMLRVQQISGQAIPLVCTEHGQQARCASRGLWVQICTAVHTQKRNSLPRQRFRGAAEVLRSQALLSGLVSSSPGKHMKPNPTGMRIHSLAQRKGAGGEQQTSTRGIPRQLQVRGKGAQLILSSTHLWTPPQLSREHGAA